MIIRIKNKNKIRLIGSGHPVFIVAEMSGNHNHNIKRAYKIIDAASEAGADAIKLQTYTPDTMTINSDKEYFWIKTGKLWKGQTLYNLYKKAYTPWEWQPKLKKYAEEKGLICFSTPFDETAVDFLETMNMPLYKIASYEITDIPLLRKIGHIQKPVIMSRGMATVKEINLALKILKEAGTKEIAVLHCVSSYPANPADMNLKTIPDIERRFGVISGLSDHGISNTAAIASVALGARIIEKHLTLSRKDGGVDSAFSLEPGEFRNLVLAIRETEATLGKIHYGPTDAELKDKLYRKSIFVVEDIQKGEKFTKENIRVIRPGYGLAPRYFDCIIGKSSSRYIERGTPIKWDMVKK